MRPFAVLLIAALTIATPAAALAEAAQPPAAIEHTHQMAKVGDYTAVFHFNAASHPIYTCPMHPAVTSSKPFATCPDCKMDLEMQTHTLGITVSDKDGQDVKLAKVRLEVVNKRGMTQTLDLKLHEMYEGQFCLGHGTYQVTAYVSLPRKANPLIFKTTYINK